jgi:hypothetical protein
MDYWSLKAGETPIALGGGATGWMYFLFRGIPRAEIEKEQPLAVLSFIDIYDKPWFLESRISGPNPLRPTMEDVQKLEKRAKSK